MTKRLRHTHTSPAYLAARAPAIELKETNDCTVVAISLTTGVDYADVRQALADCGREHGQAAYFKTQREAIQLLGFRLQPFSMGSITSKYPQRYQLLGRGVTTYSPRRFPAAFKHMTGRYIFYSYGHVSAFVNGELQDWAASTPKPVSEIFEVLKR